ncbi:hypothetical protein ILUMI_11620 [Ignelater luminosus]|uniref:TOG domain-containing protein n=1 Tax=Ignelater luminosus TaxID=2038154 RepID=A0A8K0D061_IGNLU|nr:hypothetical protein ILUMI_11620 [Ignelater luminosus]
MENTSNDKLDFQEVIRRNGKLLRQHRPSLGNRTYPSHPEINKIKYQERLFHSSKPNLSHLTDGMTKLKQNQQENFKVTTNPDIIDSCTQTSKTILQLASLETGNLSPDSLMQSPRDFERPNMNKQLNTSQINSAFQACAANSQYTLEGSVSEQQTSSLTYIRKNSLNEYLNNYKPVEDAPAGDNKIELYPKKSLTETFLKKKKHTNIKPTCHCRSRFLQQTSPLRNLPTEITTFPTKKANDYFKSHSYVEPQKCDYDQEEDEFPEKLPLPISRFTVKNVRERSSVGKTQSMQCYWSTPKPTETSSKFEHVYESFDDEGDDEGIDDSDNQVHYKTCKNSRRKFSGSFMSPTFSSEQKSQHYKVQDLKNLISPTRRGKSLSPHRHSRPSSKSIKKSNREKIPYIDESQINLELRKPEIRKEMQPRSSIIQSNPFPLMSPLATRPKFDEDLLKIDLQSLNIKSSEETLGESVQPSGSTSISSGDNIISTTMSRIRNPDWNISLRGLAEMTELCRIMDADFLFPHMTAVNQKLLELLRSPRSHVCRTACQAAGHFFESMKDTRKPEFDDIVEMLLCKTADANKFIRKDANLSLDCMVTHIPIFHSIRSLCLKGPTHKNALVRTATIRLIICAVVIAGPDVVLNGSGLDITRKRIIQHMAKFIDDKDQDTRKYAERLFKVLCKESTFESNLRKYLEKDEIIRMKSALKSRHEKK